LIWQEKELRQTKLIPISLGFGQPRWVMGRPLLIDAVLGQKIISDLKRLSEPFGVNIEYNEKENVGLVIFPKINLP
jgi:hypothetical protein